MDSNDQIFPVFQPDPEGRRVPVYVRKKAVPFIRAGHPWLFDDSIERVSADTADGDIAVLFGPDKKFLAAGLYDRTSPVRVKVYSNSSKLPPVGAELFAHLAANAAALRAGQCLADIVHAGKRWAAPQEDHLPGSVRFILQPRNVINVRAGLERKRPRLRRFAHGLIGQLLKKLRKFQHTGGFFKEFCHS